MIVPPADHAPGPRPGRAAPGCSCRPTPCGTSTRRCRRSPTWPPSRSAPARVGAHFVATLPLYAAFLDDPFDPSPYAPESRLHWNEVYIDDHALAPAPIAPLGELVDWSELAARRRGQLLEASRDLDPFVQAGIDALVAARPDVADHARFLAARPTAADAGAPEALVTRSYLLAQYLAERQLAEVEIVGQRPAGPRPTDRQPPHGLRDVGPRQPVRDRNDRRRPARRVLRRGSGLGLPAAAARRRAPQRPRAVAAARRHGRSTRLMLRVDHVMGVHRLWWIPEGMGADQGAYVRYPREELLAVIAAEAARTATTIIGENLGTVPDEVRDGLDRWDVLGMYEEQFSLYHAHALPHIPARSVAGIRTHDMPAFAAAFEGDATGDVYDYRRLLTEAVGHPVGDSPADVLDAALERLAASDAYAVVIDVDDLIGEIAPHNVPGRVLPSTWRRRLPPPVGRVLADLDVRRRIKLLSTRTAARREVPCDDTQPGRRARPPPVQRGHPPPPPRMPRRPHRRHGHVVRGVGAERGVGRRARRLRRLARPAARPRRRVGHLGGPRRRGARRAVVPLRRHHPRRPADGEVRPGRRGDQHPAVDGVGDRRPRPRVGRRRVDGGTGGASCGRTRRSRSTSCTSARGAALATPGRRFPTYEEMADPIADHVLAHGFTHVELLPIMEHPFYGSWGYQTTGLLRPDRPLRLATAADGDDRPPAPARRRRHPRLGAVALPDGRATGWPASTARTCTSTPTPARATTRTGPRRSSTTAAARCGRS